VRDYDGVNSFLDTVSPDDSPLLFHEFYAGNLVTFDLASGAETVIATGHTVGLTDAGDQVYVSLPHRAPASGP